MHVSHYKDFLFNVKDNFIVIYFKIERPVIDRIIYYLSKTLSKKVLLTKVTLLMLL